MHHRDCERNGHLFKLLITGKSNNSPTLSLRFCPIILHCVMDRFVIGVNSGLVLVHLERDCITEGGRTEEERSAGTKNSQGW